MEWEAFAPLMCNAVDSLPREAFRFSGDLSLEVTPDFIKTLGELERLSEEDRNDMKASGLSLVCRYQAEAISDIQSKVFAKLMELNVSLWLSRPSDVTLRHVFHFNMSHGEPVWRMRTKGSIVAPHPDYAATRMVPEDLERTKLLLAGLTRRRGAVKGAIWMLTSSLVQRSYAVRFPLVWTALEALFGTSSAELSYRLALRLSMFIAAGDKPKVKPLFDEVRELYKLRSKFVHGGEPSRPTATMEKILRSEMLLPDSLVRILMNEDLFSIFSTDQRETFLDDLVLAS